MSAGFKDVLGLRVMGVCASICLRRKAHTLYRRGVYVGVQVLKTSGVRKLLGCLGGYRVLGL